MSGSEESGDGARQVRRLRLEALASVMKAPDEGWTKNTQKAVGSRN